MNTTGKGFGKQADKPLKPEIDISRVMAWDFDSNRYLPISQVRRSSERTVESLAAERHYCRMTGSKCQIALIDQMIDKYCGKQ